MTEQSFPWDGVAGDGGPYGHAEMMDFFFRMVLNGTGNRGPLKGWLDELEVAGAASPLSVGAGAAVVYGMFYHSDGAVGVGVSTPSAGNSRYDRIVVRRDWTAQTVRLARVVGVAAAAPAIPALTQVAGAIYEIPLATALIDDAGVITLTDDREFCQFTTAWPANAVGSEHILIGSLGPASVQDRTRYWVVGAGQIEADSVAGASWVAGASYDYWDMPDAANDAIWAIFFVPTDYDDTHVTIYLWSTPDVNGGLGPAENVEWDWSADVGPAGPGLANTSGTATVDQSTRVNTTAYRDQLCQVAVNAGDVIVLWVSRDGVADSYNNDMRLFGLEPSYNADS